MKDNRSDSEKLAALVYPVVNGLFGFFRVLRQLIALFFLVPVVGALSHGQFFIALLGAVLIFVVMPNAYIAASLDFFGQCPG